MQFIVQIRCWFSLIEFLCLESSVIEKGGNQLTLSVNLNSMIEKSNRLGALELQWLGREGVMLTWWARPWVWFNLWIRWSQHSIWHALTSRIAAVAHRYDMLGTEILNLHCIMKGVGCVQDCEAMAFWPVRSLVMSSDCLTWRFRNFRRFLKIVISTKDTSI